MKKSWRLLIACCLLVLLPLQGFAVASGFGCAMGMSGKLAAMQSAVADNPHCQNMDGKGATADALVKQGKVHDHCKSASPCCMGMALMPAAQLPVFTPVHNDVQVLPVLLPASVSASTLERPPRYSHT
ncbi:hypothetical protein [Undibacterium sp. TS12]|uniref:hypothetical protein n=1 Tax=Undibacterium sp. TS12 TaxID=2908202 RepID=UPI001F4C7024|nr:hypothetical protein [Undibacterium sp. TS12]MCH8620937.1 hypothetical protein [Undibacterium sp. TS12]